MSGVRGRAVGAAFKARHSDRAGSDVVERGRLLCGELIENVVGIALAGAQSLRGHLLVDEGHDAGKGGGRPGGAAGSKKIGEGIIQSAGASGVGLSQQVEGFEKSGASDNAKLWNIAFHVLCDARS